MENNELGEQIYFAVMAVMEELDGLVDYEDKLEVMRVLLYLLNQKYEAMKKRED